MDYRAFEQRLLETIFTTDVQLTPATIAYLYKLSVQEAADLLQQAAVQGLLNIESDDDGNLLYTYPNRTKLRRDGAQPPEPSREHALVRAEPSALDRPGPASGVTPGLGLGAGIVTAVPPALAVDAHAVHPSRPASGEAQDAGAPQVRCPFCGEAILLGAKKCRHCHEYLDYTLRDIQSIKTPGVALAPIPREPPGPASLVPWNGLQPALLSFFIPGLGQICTGRVPAGLLWMMFTVIGYFPLVIPGIILHILCIINATKPPRQLT